MTPCPQCEGVVSKVAHGPTFLTFDVRVTSGRGPTNPMEERGIRLWGTDKGVPGPDCKILQVKHDLFNANRQIPHQALHVLQRHISIRVLSNPQTFDISLITNPLHIMHTLGARGHLPSGYIVSSL